MKTEWRIVHQTKSSSLKRLWIYDGIWQPTERYAWDSIAMPIIAGGAPDVINCPGNTADAHVLGYNADYSIAHSTSAQYENVTAYIYVGQCIADLIYQVSRGFLKFDTHEIPTTAIILQVNLQLNVHLNSSNTDFDVQIIKQNWSAQDPITYVNCEAAFDNCLAGTQDDNIWRNTAGIVVNTSYISGNLNTSWINKGGFTYYSLRSSRDYANITPTGWEAIDVHSANDATVAYRPLLIIIVDIPDIPRSPAYGLDPMIF